MKNETFKISESTNLTLDLKTIIIVIGFTISLVSVYYSLLNQIEDAKLLPTPTLTATEWKIKDELIRTTVQQNAQALEEIKQQLNKLENRIYEISK
tara:strand:+ start:2395 stop:2682 length:288 start_codon:yes stop_codon:yes gene_type:complete